MKKSLTQILLSWPQPFIKDMDLAILLKIKNQSRYDLVNRCIKNHSLVPLRRGLYLIPAPYRKETPDAFLLAQQIYGPSYISFESALSFHGWIPEAVYNTTSACAKRSKTFHNAIGIFSYRHIPATCFYNQVDKQNGFLMASPWKALADCIYAYKKTWKCFEDMSEDMRIEKEDMQEASLESLKDLSENYPSKRVRQCLRKLFKELNK